MNSYNVTPSSAMETVTYMRKKREKNLQLLSTYYTGI